MLDPRTYAVSSKSKKHNTEEKVIEIDKSFVGAAQLAEGI